MSRSPGVGYSNAAGAFRADLWRERPFRADLPACEDKEWALHWLQQGYSCVVDPTLVVDHDHPAIRCAGSSAERREAQGCAMFLEMDAAVEPTQVARAWWADLALV